MAKIFTGTPSFKSVQFSPSMTAFRSVAEWSNVLNLPVGAIIYHSNECHIRVFMQLSWDADFCSFDASSFSQQEPTDAIKMTTAGVIGLVLTPEDIRKLAAGNLVRTSIFSALLRKNYGWIEMVAPIVHPWNISLPPENRRIGIERPVPQSEGNSECPSLYEFAISPTGACILDQDMERFREHLYHGGFTNDIFFDSKIVEELPPYVSVKLKELIEANRLYWRNYVDADTAEHDRRRARMREYLQEDFIANCDEQTSKEGLLEHAIRFADPTAVHESKRLQPSASATENLLILLTAAKLFWAPHLACNHSYETYPDRDAMAAFLRFMGMSSSNAATAGVAIIRPEGIDKPPRPLKGTIRLTKKRQPSNL